MSSPEVSDGLLENCQERILTLKARRQFPHKKPSEAQVAFVERERDIER